MDTTYTFRNMETTDALRDHTENKFAKLKKLIIKPENAHIIFKVEKFNHTAEITMVADGVHYVVHHTSNDMYTSIDSAIKKLEKQLKSNKERVKNHKTGLSA